MHLTGLSDTVGPSAGAAETSVALELGPRWSPARLQRGGRGGGAGAEAGNPDSHPQNKHSRPGMASPGVVQSGTRSALGAVKVT